MKVRGEERDEGTIVGKGKVKVVKRGKGKDCEKKGEDCWKGQRERLVEKGKGKFVKNGKRRHCEKL